MSADLPPTADLAAELQASPEINITMDAMSAFLIVGTGHD